MLKLYRFLVLAAMIVLSACSDEGKKQSSNVVSIDAAVVAQDTQEVKNVFQVDLADTQEKIYHGLMGRTSIAENYGLLFDVNIAPKDAQIAFWMKDTLIPLDMLFMDKDGVIFFIHKDAQPNDVTAIIPPKRPRAVLEVNAGQVDKYGISVGDVLKADLFGNN